MFTPSSKQPKPPFHPPRPAIERAILVPPFPPFPPFPRNTMTMQNHNPLASLLALAVLGAVLNSSQTKPAPQPEPARNPSLDDLMAKFFGAAPAGAATQGPTTESTATQAPDLSDSEFLNPIAQVCAIPQDIADRCGMNDAGFDPHGKVGCTVALLAAALTNLRELRGNCEPSGAAKCLMADQNIGAAIAALGLLEPATPTTTA